MERWKEQRALWLAHHGLPLDGSADDLPDPDRTAFHREFTARFHELLDAGHGGSLLARPQIAEILATQLTAGHDASYQIGAWVIMPNHIHALVEPLEKHTLGAILQRWKGASARMINQALGRSGSLWQAETFDHIVRSEAQFDHYRRYIAGNPGKAGLTDGYVLGRGNRAGITAEEVLKT
jgi:REP element-mobilizing transposase RayT